MTDAMNPLTLPDIGEADPGFAIHDEGTEYLAAITRLDETTDQPFVYLGWLIEHEKRHGYNRYIAKRPVGWRLEAPSAVDLVMAIFVLEQNRVTALVGGPQQ